MTQNLEDENCEEYLEQGTSSLGNTERESCVDLAQDDEMIEAMWNTLGIPGSFSSFVND